MLNITFTGDVHFSAERWDGGLRSEILFEPDIMEVLRRSHYAVFNIEGPLTLSPPEKKKGIVLHSLPQSTETLRALHCNVLNLANNHIFDHGLPGLQETIDIAKNNGWLFLGAGENIEEASAPIIIRREGVSVGLLSVGHNEGLIAGPATPGVFCDLLEDRIQTIILGLREQCDWVVVVYHGGEEYTRVPMPPRRRKLLRYLSYGADVVVAHHAHVVQGYEIVGGKHLFYGLGDFVFDLDTPCVTEEERAESVILSLRFCKQSLSFAPLFTHQNRVEGNSVKKMPSNQSFRRIYPETYAREWGDEARRRLGIMWNRRLSNVKTESLGAKLMGRKGRTIAALIRMLRHQNLRPIIMSGFAHLARSAFDLRR